jgi:hypothetical protein
VSKGLVSRLTARRLPVRTGVSKNKCGLNNQIRHSPWQHNLHSGNDRMDAVLSVSAFISLTKTVKID